MDQKLAEGLVDALRGVGIDFITYLPETRLSEIIPLLQRDTSFQMVPEGPN
jgi:sulfopyruvate decarboxylase TPP-binding subunit